MASFILGWLTGWCNDKSGRDQNSGLKDLLWGQALMGGSTEDCLLACKKETNATGCEFYPPPKGYCVVHTKDVGTGSGDSPYQCYVF